MTMEVVKRDGTRETVKIEKILHAVNRACRGLDRVESLEVAKRTISGLHDGSTTEELDNLSIATAVMLMSEEPNYSKVAARMLSDNIRKEVGRDTAFRDYLKTAVDVGLLNSRVFELAQGDLQSIEFAIRHERDDLFEYFGLKTVTDRYLLRHPTSRKIIERPQWMFMRVALGLSYSIPEALELYEIISQFQYMPATPTLFNSGTRHPQMSSCYLLTVADDSLEGIYKSLADVAMLSKFSGGIGIDWTPVRASGALIRGTNGLSNGIVPFLKMFDSSVHAVNQGGKRKGAAAVYLEPWHSDIENFLELRNNTGAEERRTHNLNLSLWVSDLFMKRVETDQEWSLFSPNDVPSLNNLFGEEFEAAYVAAEKEGLAKKRVPARQLYARMMQTLAETGNGWMCFKDKSNLRSAQTGREGNVIHSSNLCTEILEVTSKDQTAVCNLGSINLAAFVKADRSFDFDLLKKVARVAAKFLDRVVDENFYPTKEAKNSNHKWRPVGMGIMGLQDAFFKMRIPFGTDEAKEMSSHIQETIYYEAIQTSMELADKHGPFPAFKDSRYADGKLQVQLAEGLQAVMPKLHYDWDKVAKEVQKRGIRNSLLIAIAPTATIASIVGSYESIEPQVSNFFKRETLSGEFLQVNRYLIRELSELGLWTAEMRAKIISNEGSIQDILEIPESTRQLYRTVWEISQKDLIDMAVLRSPFICQSQSLNLFVEETTIGKLSSMYMYAWKQGVKTTYYLRSRAKTRIQKTTVDRQNLGDGAVAAGMPKPVTGSSAVVAAGTEPKKTYTAEEAIVCSLENPEACEACQ
ncbi:MAG: ribonucleoside-diphosphate reductase subunit alpha [Bdellovibrionales bacterium]|nr:ribonucleoside-diphosphate reductase subunit alpha [Bdellovibrionales bacterium]